MLLTPHRPPCHVVAGTRVLRVIATLVMVSAVVLLPWIVYLAISLPPSASARHWPAVWAGLDAAEAVGLAATGWLAFRRDRRLAFPAVSTATLLLMDAWFDVCTSPAGGPLLMAIADMGIEVGEAAGCLALAVAIWRTAPAPAPREPAPREPARDGAAQVGAAQVGAAQ